MATDPLDFGVDLADVRTRLEGLAYFLSVQDILAASDAFDETVPAKPPAAFIAISRETADPNKLIGGLAQRVNVTLSVVFAENAARYDRAAKDALDATKRAVIRILVGWVPNGAGGPLQYARFAVVRIENGLVWGEVAFTTSYRLSL